ncbi:MAG: InlB B-repeat-containing protein, partial [Firmicutes bacterium]|nr:InlB B-repeat-containing protein [Candidatus Enteromonas pullistercoris]
MEKAKTFALLLFAASLLAGCGGNGNSSQTNTGGGSTESSELTSSSEESSSSGESSSSEEEFDRSDTYAIFFHSLGGSEVETQYVEPGETASEPEDPSYDGHTFLGWYLSEAGDDLFDFSTIIESDYHLYAHWAEDGQEGEPIPMTIYFRDASWWSVAGAMTYIKLGNDASDYGVPMEKLRFCNDEYQGVGYNYWKFEIEDITEAKTAQFVRMGKDGSYWSAWTDKAILSEAGKSNMYDIRSCEELWSEPVQGSWAVYDELDMGNEDAPEP